MFAARRKDSGLDLEAVEMATRAGVHRAGSAILKGFLAEDGGHAGRVACGCGQHARYHDHRPKQLLTVLGTLRFNHGDGLNALHFTPDGQTVVSMNW